MLNESYICVTIDHETYYREIQDGDKLGELISEAEFREMLLEEALSQVVSDEYMLDLNRINRIVERLEDLGERRVMRDFVEYVMRIDGVYK